MKEIRRYWAPLEVPGDSIFHMALAVPDIEGAMAVFGPALHLDWTVIRNTEVVLDEGGEDVTRIPIRAVYSKNGPPYLELVSGPDGSFFGAENGPRLHHAGILVDDVAAEVTRLEALGMKAHGLMPGDRPRAAFVTSEHGLTLEVMDGVTIRQTIHNWFAEG